MCYSIEEIKAKASPVAEKYGVKEVSLFGSYARGEATDESDVDFYIERGNITSLLQYFSFVNDLEEIFQCHVDVVTTGIQDTDFLGTIKKEGVLIYEAE